MDPVADHSAAVAALSTAAQDDDAAAAMVADPADVLRTAGVAVPEGSDAEFNATVQAALPNAGTVRTLQAVDGSRLACLLSSYGLASTKSAPDALAFLQGLPGPTSAGDVANALCDWIGAH